MTSGMSRLFARKMPHPVLRILGALVLAGLFTWWLAVRADRAMRVDQLRQAALLVQTLDTRKLADLPFAAGDRERPEFQELCQQMRDLRTSLRPAWACADADIRVYGMKLRDGVIVLGPETIPEDDPRASAPGTAYLQPTPAAMAVFATGQPAMLGPIATAYGAVVSVLIPVVDTTGRRETTVIGVDITAEDWHQAVGEQVSIPTGLVLLLLIALAAVPSLARRPTASPRPVLRWVLFPLATVVLILAVASVVILYRQDRARECRQVAAFATEIQYALRTTLKQQTDSLAMAARLMANDPQTQRALRERDAARLLTLWQPLRKEWEREDYITHFYFCDAERVCLLRVHQPARSGDRIDRTTMLAAERTGQTTSGLELGVNGSFVLRVVQPVIVEGNLIGYVELGKELGDVLATLRLQPSDDLAVVIRKELLTRTDWEAGMGLLGRKAQWDLLPRSVLAYASRSRLPQTLMTWADHVAANPEDRHEANREIQTDGDDWWVSALPLFDAAKQPVGTVLFMRNAANDEAELVRVLVMNGTTGGVLLVLLLGFVYVLLRRTDAGISAQQAQLTKSREQYRLLSECGSDVIWLYDLAAHRFSYVSPSVEKLRGYTVAEVLKQTMAHAMTAESYRMVEQHLPNRLAAFAAGDESTRTETHEVTQTRKDGTIVPTEVVTTLVSDAQGRVTHIQGVSRDISERKRAETERLESEQRYVQLATQSRTFTWEVDATGLNTYISPVVELVLGIAPADIIGKKHFYDLHPAEGREAFKAGAFSFFAEKKGFVDLPNPCEHKDGHIVWVSTNGMPILDASGALIGYRGTDTDITERRKGEAERDRLTRTLGAIRACVQAVIHAENEQALSETVCRILVTHGKYQLAWIGHPDADAAKTVRTVASAGDDTDYLKTINITWDDSERGQGQTGTCLRTRKRVVCRDLATAPGMALWRQTLARRGYTASAAFPLQVDHELFGALMVYTTEAGSFDDHEVALLTELADDLAFGIAALRSRAARAQAETTLQKRLLYQRALTTVDATLRAAPTVAAEMNRVLKLLLDVSGMDRAYMFANHEDAEHGLCMNQTHECVKAGVPPQLANPDLQNLPYAVASPNGALLAQLARREAFHSTRHGLTAAQLAFAESQGVQEVLLLPVHAGAELWGFFGFDDCTATGRFEPDDTALLQHAANLVGWHLANARDTEALLTLNRTLEQRVAKRTADLQESEARFRQVIEMAPLPLAMADRDGATQLLNEQFTRVLGYTRDDVPDQATWWRKAHPDDSTRRALQEKWQAAMIEALPVNGVIPAMESQVTCKDGTRRYVLISGRMMPEHIVLACLDITTTKETAIELAKAKEAAESANQA